MAKRDGPVANLKRVLAEACWRALEEASAADVVIVIAATGGKKGRVYMDYGRSNPASVRGVIDAAYEQEFGDLPAAADVADEDEEDTD